MSIALKLIVMMARQLSTWSPTDKSSSIGLLVNNRKAVRNSDPANYRSVRGVRGHASGKYYFEIQLNQGQILSLAQTLLGVADSTAPLANYVGSDAHGWGVNEGGNVFHSGATTGLVVDSFTSGDVIRFAVDLDNGRLWLSKVATNWNGDPFANPATNTNGIAISAATYFPMFSAFDATQAATLNTGGSTFSGAVPSGFKPWG